MPLAQTGINRLTAVQTRAVAAGEARQVQRADGMVSMKSWLTGHCRLAGRAAAELVRDGRRLAELPRLAAAYAEGAVTPAHVAAVTAAVTPARVAVAEANGIDLATTDAVLTDGGPGAGPGGHRQGGPPLGGRHRSRRHAGRRGRAAADLPDGGQRRTAGSTCPGTWTPSAGRPCTPRWKRR